MSLSAFIPANTQKARTTGVSAFERMLKAENVSMDVVQACILGDSSGKTLAAVMDRFGYYLATYEGKKGKLARNTAISYFRNVKLWFFDEYPHLRVSTELILLKQGKTLEKRSLKRDSGGFTNKAPSCTKEDLHSLIRYVYNTASVASDYEDAALACLMWHCFGRSSDLGYASKQHITMSANNVFYVRMLRVKTTEEQGLTLVPDRDDFLTYPLHTLAVALAMQEAPCASLLSQLPLLTTPATTSVNAGAPLLEMLQVDRSESTSAAPPPVSNLAASPSSATAAPAASGPRPPSPAAASLENSSQTRGKDGVQAYVNRFLKWVAEPARATSDLTSLSFRRGGAQHANGDDRIAAQWIFDRGSWDMTRTNKGFAYVLTRRAKTGK